MLAEAPYGIFRYATSELSSSGFWAWIFASLLENKSRAAAQQRVAGAVLKALVPGWGDPVSVRREVKVPGGRIDLNVSFPGGELIVENKVSAIPTATQLASYLADGDRRNTAYALFSTAFDDDVIDALPGVQVDHGVRCAERPWVIFRTDDLLRAASEGLEHPLIADYAANLEHIGHRRRSLRHMAFSSDPVQVAAALETAEGQWYLMAALMTEIGGRRYRGVNRDGCPWTQCAFQEENEDLDRDLLFYRIDFDRGPDLTGRWRPYLSLQQHRYNPDPGKSGRLAILREHAATALDQVRAAHGYDVHSYAPADRRISQKESAVIRFNLERTPYPVLRGFLPAFHERFWNGWSQDLMFRF